MTKKTNKKNEAIILTGSFIVLSYFFYNLLTALLTPHMPGLFSGILGGLISIPILGYLYIKINKHLRKSGEKVIPL